MKKNNINKFVTAGPEGNRESTLNKETTLLTAGLPVHAGNDRKSAFSLIELLVVVLIIGILAAIAVPQYQKAVIKARVATIMPFGAALAKAKEVYYMENGEYVRDAEILGIELPATCTRDTTGGTGYYSCGNYFVLDNNPGNVSLNYCPGYAEKWTTCYPKRDFAIVFTQQHLPENSPYTMGGAIYCAVYYNSELGKSICKSFPELNYIKQ